MAISPLIFSVIYDEVGNVRGQEMLVAQQRIQCIDRLEVILKLTRNHKMLQKWLENIIAQLAEYDGVDTFGDRA